MKQPSEHVIAKQGIKLKGIFYMTINSITSSALNVGQKYILYSTMLRVNPIHPFEYTYWVMVLLLILYLLTMKIIKEDLFPIPKASRMTFLLRCLTGSFTHVCFLLSLQYISLSKASVFIWTSPIFTALFASVYLNEKLTVYDWGAAFVAFLGIVMIVNPFQRDDDENLVHELIGAGLALAGAVFMAIAAICIRLMTSYSQKLHMMLVPMGFVLGNILLCPIFMTIRVTLFQGSQTHVMEYQDIGILLFITLTLYFSQIFQAQAYRYEKAGRVAPILYLQIILSCIADIILFGTQLTANQIVGGLIIILSNFSIAVLKCLEIIK